MMRLICVGKHSIYYQVVECSANGDKFLWFFYFWHNWINSQSWEERWLEIILFRLLFLYYKRTYISARNTYLRTSGICVQLQYRVKFSTPSCILPLSLFMVPFTMLVACVTLFLDLRLVMWLDLVYRLRQK